MGPRGSFKDRPDRPTKTYKAKEALPKPIPESEIIPLLDRQEGSPAGDEALSSRDRRKAKRRAERAAARAAQAVAGQAPDEDDDQHVSSSRAADEVFGAASDESEEADAEFAENEEPISRPIKEPARRKSAVAESAFESGDEDLSAPVETSVYGTRTLPPGREDDACFVVEGRRAVDAVIDGPLPLRAVILIRPEAGQEDSTEKFGDIEDRAVRRGIEVRRVDAKRAKKYFETRHPQGVAALVVRPDPPDVEAVFASARRVLVLDGVSDPGNAGTLVRTAWLFGWDAVFATPGSVDLFSEKAVRASAGALVHLPIARVSASLLATLAARNGFRVRVGAPGTGAGDDGVEGKLVLVLGNEARGVESPWPGAIPVGIAMRSGPIDSLGVVASGAILLDRLR